MGGDLETKGGIGCDRWTSLAGTKLTVSGAGWRVRSSAGSLWRVPGMAVDNGGEPGGH